MAYWDGGSGTQDGSRISPSPDVRQIHSPNSEPFPTDTEENVVEQAEDVVRNFIFESYRHELEESDSSDVSTPSIPELTNFTSDPLSRASQVGRQLARIGDDINRRYADEFTDMINQLNITDDTAYEVFAGVAKNILPGCWSEILSIVVMRLFAEGINWGRVSALMCLAYRIAMSVLKLKERAQRFAEFLKVIVSYVVRFIKETIASWIASQGGWGAALEYTPSMSLKSLSIVVGSCVMAVAAVFYLSKKS